jgi:hypothetical protein
MEETLRAVWSSLTVLNNEGGIDSSLILGLTLGIVIVTCLVFFSSAEELNKKEVWQPRQIMNNKAKMLDALGGEDNEKKKHWAKVIELIKKKPDAAREKSECHGAIPLRYAASRKAPLDIFKTILKAYPEGVKQADNEGSLPLHWAKTPDVARLLLDAYRSRKCG